MSCWHPEPTRPEPAAIERVNEMAASVAPRIRELTSPALQLVSALHRLVLGFTVGNIATFLLVVVIGLVFEEVGVASMLGIDLDFDALFRASMIPVLISWGAMTLVWPAVIVAQPFALASAAREFARQHPDDAPPRDVRQEITNTPANAVGAMGTVLMFIFGVLLLILILMTIYMASQSFDSFLISLAATGVGVVPFGVGYAMRRYRHRKQESQEAWANELRAQWNAAARRADAAEQKGRANRPAVELPALAHGGGWSSTVLPWMLMIGFAVFMLGVLLRQPCRDCDQVTWGAAGENLIALLSGAGGTLLTLAGVICAALWLFSTGRAFVSQQRVRRWVSTAGDVRVNDDERLAEELARPDGLGLLALTLAGFGTTVLTIAGGIAMVEWEGMDASVALVVGQAMLFAAVLIGLVAARRETQFRMLLRDALLPGDVLPQAEVVRRRELQRARREAKRKASSHTN